MTFCIKISLLSIYHGNLNSHQLIFQSYAENSPVPEVKHLKNISKLESRFNLLNLHSRQNHESALPTPSQLSPPISRIGKRLQIMSSTFEINTSILKRKVTS